MQYTLETLHAMQRGLLKGQTLRVTARDANGYVFSGTVSGMGGRIGINADDGKLIEDIKAEWIMSATVRQV
jgi:hypothetical protein